MPCLSPPCPAARSWRSRLQFCRVYRVVVYPVVAPFPAMAEMRALLARNLRLWRNARGLSQEELADRAGINRGYMSDLENGRYSATIVMIGKLADALAIEPAELLRMPAKSGSSRQGRARSAAMLEAAEEPATFAAPKPRSKKRR